MAAGDGAQLCRRVCRGCVCERGASGGGLALHLPLLPGAGGFAVQK